ncbi:MAG: DegQ family serine endoprotease [Gammaproteobacteria bacterium]
MRRMKTTLILLSMVMTLGISPLATAGLPLSLLSSDIPSLAPMLEKTIPGVVNISTKTKIRVQENPLFSDPFFRRFFDIPSVPRERESQSLGSGVVIDAEKGYVMTNNHVIDKADEITVTLGDRRNFSAKVIGTDPEVDLAVIQIDADNLTAVPLSDSDKLRVGDFVVAIGNPFGLGQTVTSGIVSALGRNNLGIEGYEDFIQTDASINPGNSGGALVNLRGELVGINTAIVGPSGGNVGIGFAIPINMSKDIADQLIRYGEVRRGQLGVTIQDLTPELANAFNITAGKGVVISQVAEGSPAQKAGIKPGDIVISVDNKPVTSVAELRNVIGLQRVGEKVELIVIRDGKERQLSALIEEPKRTKVDGGDINQRLDGALFSAIGPGHPLAGKIAGIEVLDVTPGSPAWHAGLRKGDIIVSANRIPVEDITALRNAIGDGRRGILFNIRRGDGALFLVIR